MIRHHDNTRAAGVLRHLRELIVKDVSVAALDVFRERLHLDDVRVAVGAA
jgi:hypothetical protein